MTKPINRAQAELEGMPEAEQRLTPMQLKFVIAYLTHFNGALAARQAGYSKRTASSIAHENLSKPHIQRFIKRRMDSLLLSTDEILGKLGMMARGEIPTKTVVKGSELQLVFDERQALENLGKADGLFVDRHQLERIDGLDIIDDTDDEDVTITEPDAPLLTDDGDG